MNPFRTMAEMFSSLLSNHFDKKQIDQIAASQSAMKESQDAMQADLLSIKVFLEIPDSRIVATQQDLDKLGNRLEAGTQAAQQFDVTIPEAAQNP